MNIEAELLTAIYYQQRVITCSLAAMMDIMMDGKAGCMDDALTNIKDYQEMSRKALAKATREGLGDDESDD